MLRLRVPEVVGPIAGEGGPPLGLSALSCLFERQRDQHAREVGARAHRARHDEPAGEPSQDGERLDRDWPVLSCCNDCRSRGARVRASHSRDGSVVFLARAAAQWREKLSRQAFFTSRVDKISSSLDIFARLTGRCFRKEKHSFTFQNRVNTLVPGVEGGLAS